MFVRFRPRWRTSRATLLLALFGSGCGSSVLPTAPTPVHSTWQYVTPSVPVGGSSVSTFAVPSNATIGLTLASVVTPGGAPILPTLRLVLGTPAGANCTATSTKDVAPGWTAQIQTALSSGNYCVSVMDTSNALPATSLVTVRIATSDSAPTTSANLFTDLVTGTMLKGGSLMHEYAVSFGGTATISLTSAGDGTQSLAIGAGVWDGSTCRLLTQLTATAGTTPLVTQTADGGRYCLTIADPGQLTGPTLFAATISHP